MKWESRLLRGLRGYGESSFPSGSHSVCLFDLEGSFYVLKLGSLPSPHPLLSVLHNGLLDQFNDNRPRRLAYPLVLRVL